jgi:hypothetical protein
VFQGLLQHLWDPGAVGERARRGMTTCLGFPNIAINFSPLKIPTSQDNPSPTSDAVPITTENNTNADESASNSTNTGNTDNGNNVDITVKKEKRQALMINYPVLVNQLVRLFSTFCT